MKLDDVFGKIKAVAGSAANAASIVSDGTLKAELREDGVLTNSAANLTDVQKIFTLYVLNMSDAMFDVTDYGFIIGKNSVSMCDERFGRFTVFAGRKVSVKMDTVDLIDKIKFVDTKQYNAPLYWYAVINGHKVTKKSKYKYSDVIYSK